MTGRARTPDDDGNFQVVTRPDNQLRGATSLAWYVDTQKSQSPARNLVIDALRRDGLSSGTAGQPSIAPHCLVSARRDPPVMPWPGELASASSSYGVVGAANDGDSGDSP